MSPKRKANRSQAYLFVEFYLRGKVSDHHVPEIIAALFVKMVNFAECHGVDDVAALVDSISLLLCCVFSLGKKNG